MAKKAQANGKAHAKIKAQSPAKKVGKASASAKASNPKAVKSPVKGSVNKATSKAPTAKAPTVKKASSPKVEKKQSLVPPVETSKKTPGVLKKAPVKGAADKPTQGSETSEKIKIDKSMTDEQVKWAEMYNKYKDAQASIYDMKATFQAASPLQHKVLGWGWIVSNENDRLEVLFRDGKRMLISNYHG